MDRITPKWIITLPSMQSLYSAAEHPGLTFLVTPVGCGGGECRLIIV